MKKTVLFFTMLLCLCTSCSFAQQSKEQTNQKVYDEQIDPQVQIDKALAEAKANGKYVICQVGGNWCPWCIKFAGFITSDAEIAKMVSDNFVYIHVNYPRRGQGTPNLAVMKKLGNPQRFGFPVMVVLDADGKVLHIQDSSYLEEGQGYSKQKVMSFFKNWTPTAVKGE